MFLTFKGRVCETRTGGSVRPGLRVCETRTTLGAEMKKDSLSPLFTEQPAFFFEIADRTSSVAVVHPGFVRYSLHRGEAA
jgi:hypothetical protein